MPIAGFRNSPIPYYIPLQLVLFSVTVSLALSVCIGQGGSLFIALEWTLLAMKLHSYQNPHSSTKQLSWFNFLIMPTLVYPKQEFFDESRKIDWKCLASNVLSFILTFIVVNIIRILFSNVRH